MLGLEWKEFGGSRLCPVSGPPEGAESSHWTHWVFYISAWSRTAFVPVLEHPNFLHPNLNQPISFCQSMEPPNFLRPSLELPNSLLLTRSHPVPQIHSSVAELPPSQPRAAEILQFHPSLLVEPPGAILFLITWNRLFSCIPAWSRRALTSS